MVDQTCIKLNIIHKAHIKLFVRLSFCILDTIIIEIQYFGRLKYYPSNTLYKKNVIADQQFQMKQQFNWNEDILVSYNHMVHNVSFIDSLVSITSYRIWKLAKQPQIALIKWNLKVYRIKRHIKCNLRERIVIMLIMLIKIGYHI